MPFYIISRMERTSYTENAKDISDALIKFDRAIKAGYSDARCIDKDGNEISRAELEAKASSAEGTPSAARTWR